MNTYKKIYRLLILPSILLVIAYLLLVLNITNGDIVSAVLKPWGVAIVLMLINHIYLEHIFTTPRDGLVNSLNAIVIAIILYNSQNDSINFWIIFSYSIAVFLSGLIFLLYCDKHRKINLFTRTAGFFGKAKVIFPFVAIIEFTNFDIVGESFKISFSYKYLGWIALFYLLFLFLTKKEIIEWTKNMPSLFFNIFSAESIGIIKANLAPNIVLAQFNSNSNIKINDLILIGEFLKEKDGKLKKENADKVAMVLDFVGMESEENVVSVRLYLLNEPQLNLDSERSGLIKINSECKIIPEPKEFLKNLNSVKITYYWERRDDIVALVSSLSTINILRADIIGQKQLENAELVSTINNNNIENPIRYQIIEAETHRENQEETKDYGYTKLIAYQLGEWRKPKDSEGNEIKNKFRQFFEFQWTPHINSLMFKWNKSFDEKNIKEEDVETTGFFLLGNIPKTNLPIYLKVKDLVSHHTAVLGVTGSGKSTLVFKILDEVNKSGTLVICIDITGEYKNKIKDFEKFFDDETGKKWTEEIEKMSDGRRKKELPFGDKAKINAEELDKLKWGCINSINKIVKDRIIELRAKKRKVIFELLDISNTKISIDCTQYIIQGLLEYAKGIYDANILLESNERDNFQSCVVLEEAHTLVPENIGVGGRYSDSQVVIDKISQIALQGRKYNVGFILISQRTATVKKTVLNQCNTMISFRAYDETSFNFLSSYFGEEYVKEISHLKNDGDSRYVIASGKAVVADRPVIVEVRK